jgi:copper chaperone CopZ
MNIIQIENLKCGGCANTIKKGLTKLEGVTDVEINIDASEVMISTENDEVLVRAIQKLSSMGYPEAGEVNTVMKKAKSYVSCAVGRINSEN